MEFVRGLDGQPVTYCEGHCLAYGSATPYLPVRDLLRQLWGLPDAALAPAVTATVHQRLCEAGIASEAEALLLLQLLDVPVDLAPLAALSPEMRKAQTFALLRHLLRYASQQQPLLLAVENLHWSDPTSEEWLASLMERLGDMPVLLLVTYRPGYQPPWLRHSAATQMALPAAVTPRQPGSAAVRATGRAAPRIAATGDCGKSGGQSLLCGGVDLGRSDAQQPRRPLAAAGHHRSGAGSAPGPPPPEAKRLVQIAAVIGPEVPVPLLDSNLMSCRRKRLQRGLAHLQATEFLYETLLFPGPVYTFKHALTHEVAYGSLLPQRRRVLHACIVETLEALTGDQVAEQVERLAHHALRGEVWDEALAYSQQAGEKAMARAAHREAVGCLEQALVASQHLPVQPRPPRAGHRAPHYP